GGAGVLGSIGQGLGDRVVSGDLNRLGQPALHLDIELDGNSGSAGQRLQRRAQATVGQDGRVQAPGGLAQTLQAAVHSGGHVVQLLCDSACAGPRGCLCGAQLQGEGDQALLGAVVQVALDAAAGGISGGHDPCPRGSQGGLGLGVGDGGGGQ